MFSIRLLGGYDFSPFERRGVSILPFSLRASPVTT